MVDIMMVLPCKWMYTLSQDNVDATEHIAMLLFISTSEKYSNELKY